MPMQSNIDKINKEYQDYLSDLEKQSLHIKYKLNFYSDIDKILKLLDETTINIE